MKRRWEAEPSQEKRHLESFKETVANQGLESTTAAAEDKSGEKKLVRAEDKPGENKLVMLRKRTRKEQDIDKAKGPGNESSLQRNTGSADQIDDETPLDKDLKSLRATVKWLRKENFKLRRKFMKEAALCMELIEKNRVILNEIKEHNPLAGNILEAMYPENTLSTDSESSSLDSGTVPRGTIYKIYDPLMNWVARNPPDNIQQITSEAVSVGTSDESANTGTSSDESLSESSG